MVECHPPEGHAYCLIGRLPDALRGCAYAILGIITVGYLFREQDVD